MPFWSKTLAAPRWIDTWFNDRTPRFLRVTRPAEPPIPVGLSAPVRLTIDDVGPLCAFWTASYSGDDWYMDAQPSWVSTYLKDPAVIILAAYNASGAIVATIVSTPFSGDRTEMSNGGMLPVGSMRVIEGLCLAKAWRSKGVAGYLIGVIDCWTSKTLPVAHMWSKESRSAPLMTTALRTDTYAMLKTQQAKSSVDCERLEWRYFSDVWFASVSSWINEDAEGKKPPRIIGVKPINRSDDIHVWIVNKRFVPPQEPRKIVVMSNTHRRSIPGDELIYEVIWCGYLVNGRLKPNGGDRGFRPLIESVASNYKNSVLFASSGCMGGEAGSEWSMPWRYGRSGVHSWHIYNYMPPVFGTCEILSVRNEI